MRFVNYSAIPLLILVAGCAVTSARQPYQTSNGGQMLIAATMQAGQIEFFINGKSVIKNSILNFGTPFSGVYEEKQVTALCKHTKHFFSVENECDVFVDNKFAANLYLR